MTTTSGWRRWILLIAVATLTVTPLRGQGRVEQNAGAGTTHDLTLVRTEGGAAFAIINGCRITFVPGAKPDAAEAPLEDVPSIRKARVLFLRDFEDLIYFSVRDEAEARARFVMILEEKLNMADRICELSDSQREKLRLAGRGDMIRFLRTAEDIKARYESAAALIRDVDEFDKWAKALSHEVAVQWAVLGTGPFDGNSLFVKTLKRALNPEQVGKYARAATAGG